MKKLIIDIINHRQNCQKLFVDHTHKRCTCFIRNQKNIYTTSFLLSRSYFIHIHTCLHILILYIQGKKRGHIILEKHNKTKNTDN